MNARIIFFLITFVSFIYEMITMKIAEDYRKQPLPIEVSDIYDQERYQTYLNYTKDHRKLMLWSQFISLGILCLFMFTPYFKFIESLSKGSVYRLFWISFMIDTVVSFIKHTIFEYMNTFKIREKYGLNKMDMKEFKKDLLLDQIPLYILVALLHLGIIYICEHMTGWTNNFQISTMTAIVITVIIAVIFIAFALFVNVVALVIMKKQYTFTPLEGELRSKIDELQKDCKKKVKAINVYNESKKSTSKNAFLLKFLWIKEFGIADNFISENAQDELLAVLSHEIGHLKHKKNIWNYLIYSFPIFMMIVLYYCISNVQVILNLTQWINDSFDLTINNYFLLPTIYLTFFKPIMAMVSLYRNNITRLEEYEADREAVKNGYGEALVQTFKQVSSDELINVNPSPVIEFLEYDHPGMYQRIKAIQEAQEKM